MFAPLNTDAPIYHWPCATLSLMALTLLSYVVTATGLAGEWTQVQQQLGLVHDGALHPLQWVTSNFLHGSFLHLAGNLVFIWGLGLLVEGKLGWQAFLAVYLGLGVGECIVEQAVLWNSGAVSYGASAIVFGLMAMALIWAPQNDLLIGYWLPLTIIGTFVIPVWAFAVIILLVEVAVLGWLVFLAHSLPISSALLHLLGAVLGAVLATVMLRREWVDCERWDLFSILRNEHRPGAALSDSGMWAVAEPPATTHASVVTAPRRKPRDPQQAAAARKARCIRRVRKALSQQRPDLAHREFCETRQLLPDWHLPERDLLVLSAALAQRHQWSAAVGLLEEYVTCHPGDSEPIRIEAAEIMVAHQQRPHAALKLLVPIVPATLSTTLASRHHRVTLAAERLIAGGVLELEGRAWS